ncbi:MAG: AarF/UbiB family protein [Methanomicrobiales archaeon]|nr:AarF/UbiB family protein [Methanomicrobiales archaeon]
MRPGIEDLIETDITLLESPVTRLERVVPDVTSLSVSPKGIAKGFTGQILKERDLVMDGSNADRFRKNFEGIEGAK